MKGYIARDRKGNLHYFFAFQDTYKTIESEEKAGKLEILARASEEGYDLPLLARKLAALSKKKGVNAREIPGFDDYLSSPPLPKEAYIESLRSRVKNLEGLIEKQTEEMQYLREELENSRQRGAILDHFLLSDSQIFYLLRGLGCGHLKRAEDMVHNRTYH